MKYINLIIFFFLSFFFTPVLSDENIVNRIKEGNKIIFIRHSLAPGSGDPHNINLDDCDTQRNLSIEGISQSKNIGIFLQVIILKSITFFQVSGADAKILLFMHLQIIILSMHLILFMIRSSIKIKKNK